MAKTLKTGGLSGTTRKATPPRNPQWKNNIRSLAIFETVPTMERGQLRIFGCQRGRVGCGSAGLPPAQRGALLRQWFPRQPAEPCSARHKKRPVFPHRPLVHLALVPQMNFNQRHRGGPMGLGRPVGVNVFRLRSNLSNRAFTLLIGTLLFTAMVVQLLPFAWRFTNCSGAFLVLFASTEAIIKPAGPAAGFLASMSCSRRMGIPVSSETMRNARPRLPLRNAMELMRCARKSRSFLPG